MVLGITEMMVWREVLRLGLTLIKIYEIQGGGEGGKSRHVIIVIGSCKMYHFKISLSG